MFIVGFATAGEISELEKQGFEIEDANQYGLVSASSERRDGDEGLTGRSQYLLAKPESGPSDTRAVVVFIDEALYDVLPVLATLLDKPLWQVQKEAKARLGGLSVRAFESRKRRLRGIADAVRGDAENFKYCSHKNDDGSDARYPIGNGELGCICGNKWD